MLITLYDMAGKMATGLRTLLRSFWRRLKTKYRNRRLMVDVASLDKDVVLSEIQGNPMSGFIGK